MKKFIYYNLHRKCWSIRDVKSRLVEGHSDFLLIDCLEAKISEAGRQRVIKEGVKNVHAGLVGVIFSRKQPKSIDLTSLRAITYNPYKYNSFIYKDTGEKFTSGRVIMLKGGTCYAIMQESEGFWG